MLRIRKLLSSLRADEERLLPQDSLIQPLITQLPNPISPAILTMNQPLIKKMFEPNHFPLLSPPHVPLRFLG